jgi:hypothetical protein
MFMPKAFLARVIEEDCGAESSKVEIIPQFLIGDPIMESVLTRLATEAQNGSPSGELYAESACEFLAHHMLHNYSYDTATRSAGGLSAFKPCWPTSTNNSAPIALRHLAELAESARAASSTFRQPSAYRHMPT